MSPAGHDTALPCADQFTDALFALTAFQPLRPVCFMFIISHHLICAFKAYRNKRGAWAILRALTYTELFYECVSCMINAGTAQILPILKGFLIRTAL